jgi:hypothetical protein
MVQEGSELVEHKIRPWMRATLPTPCPSSLPALWRTFYRPLVCKSSSSAALVRPCAGSPVPLALPLQPFLPSLNEELSTSNPWLSCFRDFGSLHYLGITPGQSRAGPSCSDELEGSGITIKIREQRCPTWADGEWLLGSGDQCAATTSTGILNSRCLSTWHQTASSRYGCYVVTLYYLPHCYHPGHINVPRR